MKRLVAIALGSLAVAAPAVEVEFAGLLPAAERTADRLKEADADRRDLAVSTIKMLQAQLLATDARLELAETRVSLQDAVAKIAPVDELRLRIQQAQVRLEGLAADSQREQQAYRGLLEGLKEKYKAEACEPTLELRWQCPDDANGGQMVSTEDSTAAGAK